MNDAERFSDPLTSLRRQVIQAWFQYLADSRQGLRDRPETLREELIGFLIYLEEAATSLDEFTYVIADDWVREGVTESTMQLRRRVIRLFVNFLLWAGSLRMDPLERWRRASKRPVLTADQLARLISPPMSGAALWIAQTHFAILLHIVTGAPASTILGLHLTDLNLEEGRLRYTIRCRFAGECLVEGLVLKTARRYLGEVRPRLQTMGSSDLLLLAPEAQQAPISGVTFRRFLQRYGVMRGVENLTPASLAAALTDEEGGVVLNPR